METNLAPVLILTVIALVFLLFWVLVALPQRRARQTQEQIINELKVGEQVVTVGGIIGKLTQLDIDKDIAKIEIAPGLEIRIIPSAISHPLDIMQRLKTAEKNADKPKPKTTGRAK
jgi:preprotein translocase subunit YajC